MNANTIGLKDMEFGNAISSIFQKKGDELRNKLQNIGFSESESEVLEEDMDQGKVLLIITNEHDPGKLFL